jgi:hypothetical protein
VIFITDQSELNIQLPIQVLYFYRYCMPYNNKIKAMIDVVENKNLPFFAIDIDQFPKQCQEFNIETLPTFLIFSNRKELGRWQKLTSTKDFNFVFKDI